MISECIKLAKKEYKTRYNWVGKLIYEESCMRLKFNQTNIWCKHKPESILENEIHNILWDFEI